MRCPSKFRRPVAILAVALGLTLGAHAQAQPAPATKPAPNQDSQLYRNPAYGFRYQIPYGWVDRTKEMQEAQQTNETKNSELLLALFEHPPEAAANTINSAVVFASESVASYPGLKKAEDYVGPLTELATANGFKPDGDPYPIEVESRQLVRADFIRVLAAKTTGNDNIPDKRTMRQSTLILLAKGQIVSFTFIAATEDELDNLMDGLHFEAVKSPTKPRP